MPDYAFSIFSLIGVVLCFEPVYFNWRQRAHVKCLSGMFLVSWICAYNLFSFVDSIVWGGEDIAGWFDGMGYCDIGSRIKMSFPFGILGSTIGICVFLITSIGDSRGEVSPRKRRKMKLLDWFLGLGLPLIFSVVHFVIEPSRYRIIGVTGCQSSIDSSWPTLLLSTVWPPILSIISLVLAGTS
jgi:pheromone a factor receptor